MRSILSVSAVTLALAMALNVVAAPRPVDANSLDAVRRSPAYGTADYQQAAPANDPAPGSSSSTPAPTPSPARRGILPVDLPAPTPTTSSSSTASPAATAKHAKADKKQSRDLSSTDAPIVGQKAPAHAEVDGAGPPAPVAAVMNELHSRAKTGTPADVVIGIAGPVAAGFANMAPPPANGAAGVLQSRASNKKASSKPKSTPKTDAKPKHKTDKSKPTKGQDLKASPQQHEDARKKSQQHNHAAHPQGTHSNNTGNKHATAGNGSSSHSAGSPPHRQAAATPQGASGPSGASEPEDKSPAAHVDAVTPSFAPQQGSGAADIHAHPPAPIEAVKEEAFERRDPFLDARGMPIF